MNDSIVRITDIGERPVTGVSSCPFLCTGEDGNRYYVKLGNALPEEKISEWIFSFLAEKMGLPTPVGRLVLVDKDLSESSALDTSEFGSGTGYGSTEVFNTDELAYEHLGSLAPRLKAETLLFDWWIQNEDRKLGPLGGNPNILIDSGMKCWLIDHGNALDREFDAVAFFDDHAFQDQKAYWQDKDRREDWIEKAKNNISGLKERWQQLPEEWQPADFNRIEKLLKRPDDKSSEFWKPFLQ